MKTIAELETALATLFICVDGPPRAYFELPAPDAPLSPNWNRYVYHTLAYATPGDKDEVTPALVSRLWHDITSLWSTVPEEVKEDFAFLLFWRARPTIESYIDSNGRDMVRLRARLLIPGLDVSSIRKEEGEPTPLL